MPLQLDHTIVPAYDKVKSAEFIARMFGLKYEGPWGHFAPVKVNEILTLDFDDSDNPRSNHYAFLASDEEFDAILQRIKDEGSPSGAGRARGRTGRSTTCTRGAGSTSSARTGMCGRLSRTRMLRIDWGGGSWRVKGGGLAALGRNLGAVGWMKEQLAHNRLGFGSIPAQSTCMYPLFSY